MQIYVLNIYIVFFKNIYFDKLLMSLTLFQYIKIVPMEILRINLSSNKWKCSKTILTLIKGIL